MRFTVRRLLIAIAGLALVFGGITCGVQSMENRLVVENRSGQTVARLLISMPNAKVASLKDWPDGGAETVTFPINGGEEFFAVKGSMADGTELKGKFGYYTNGFYGERPRLVVKKHAILEFTD